MILAALITILLAAWLGAEIAKDPGYAFIAYQHWTVEMPLWLLLGLFAVLPTLLYLFSIFFGTVSRSCRQLYRWWRSRQHKFVLKKTNLGLVLLAEGKWRKAEKILVGTAPTNQRSLINYLAAAKAAHAQNAHERCHNYLALAQKIVPEAKVAVSLIHAELQLSKDQFEEALAILLQLYQVAPKHPYLLNLLVQVYRQINDWQALANLLPTVKKYANYSKSSLDALQLEVYQRLIANGHLTKVSLKQLWQEIPAQLRHRGGLILGYTQQLIRLGCLTEAEIQLRLALKSAWQPELVYQYGLIITENPLPQLQTAQGWLKQHGGSTLLYLTLARLASANQLWGQATHYLQECLKLGENIEACYEYGELLMQLNECESALKYYQRGLQQALKSHQITANLPELAVTP